MNHPIKDPYTACADGSCTHELSRAVTIEELLGGDGPHVSPQTLVTLGVRPTFSEHGEHQLPLRRAV